MNAGQHIHYLANKDIDREKWNACIDRADNGLIYSYSFYLQAMSKNWDGLVLGDYEAVMPLTWNKKYGIYYLYQPFLCAQLGVTGKNISTGLLESFLDAVPAKFRYWDIYLNHGNLFETGKFSLYQRNNYVLSLNRGYEELYKNYRDNIKRNIQKAKQAGCTVQKDFPAIEVMELAKEQMKEFARVKTEDFERALQLYFLLYKEGRAMTYGIVSEKKELLASCIFFFSKNRAYYILVGNPPGGKDMGASHALIDAFIQNNARKDMVLDFEGSDIPGLAFFYSSFGAVEEKYSAIRLNKLPFYLKWVKEGSSSVNVKRQT